MLSSARAVAARASAPLRSAASGSRGFAAAASAPPKVSPAAAHGHGAASHGHGHGHGHGPVDPALEMPWKFGEHPLKPRVRESWESIWWGGWVAVTAACVFVAAYGPNTSLRHWAREEALHSGFKVPDVQPDLE